MLRRFVTLLGTKSDAMNNIWKSPQIVIPAHMFLSFLYGSNGLNLQLILPLGKKLRGCSHNKSYFSFASRLLNVSKTQFTKFFLRYCGHLFQKFIIHQNAKLNIK